MPHFRPPRLAPTAAATMAVTVAATLTSLASQPARAGTPGDPVPGTTWTMTKPETVGYSSSRLDALRAWLKTGDTAAMTIVVKGRQIFEYGDVARASKV